MTMSSAKKSVRTRKRHWASMAKAAAPWRGSVRTNAWPMPRENRMPSRLPSAPANSASRITSLGPLSTIETAASFDCEAPAGPKVARGRKSLEWRA